MKKVLVVYYTQSGQLNEAVRATLAPFENSADVSVHYENIKPVTPFPFPWRYMEFCEVFPETVTGVTCELQPFSFNADENYDLIIIAYQSWFLSISIPINSFLKTVEAKKVMKNKPVVTIIACRSMWLKSQEKIKLHLKELKANLVGNITFVDRAPNLISIVTVLAFVLTGERGKFLGIFPKYGVSEDDLKEAPKFGEIVLKHLKTGAYSNQQKELVEAGAVLIKPNLMLLEGRGSAMFPIYAGFILKKGNSGDLNRRGRVRSFGILLPIGMLILSPVITIVSRMAPLFASKKIKSEIEYYSQNSLRE